MSSKDKPVHLRVALDRDLHKLLKSVCRRRGDQTRLIVAGLKWAIRNEVEKRRILEEHGYTEN